MAGLPQMAVSHELLNGELLNGGTHFWGTAINGKNGRKKRPKSLGRTSQWCHHLAPWRKYVYTALTCPRDSGSNLPLTEGQAWWMCSWQFVLKTKAQTETITGNLKETHAWGAVWLLNTCALTTCRRIHVSGGWLTREHSWASKAAAQQDTKLTLTLSGYVTLSKLWTFLILVHKAKQ